MKKHDFRGLVCKWWRRDIRPLLIFAFVIFSLRSSLADCNDVPTGSMKPTIVEGDRIFVNKLAYDLKVPFTTWHVAEWAQPERGDIVVFYSPHDGTRLVKRVIGLPGEVLELQADGLVINGQRVAYTSLDAANFNCLSDAERRNSAFGTEQLPSKTHDIMFIPGIRALRDFGPVRVPEGAYFLMGDNRDNSFDSRYFGPVPRSKILGKATTIVASLDRERYWLPRTQRSFKPLN